MSVYVGEGGLAGKQGEGGWVGGWGVRMLNGHVHAARFRKRVHTVSSRLNSEW